MKNNKHKERKEKVILIILGMYFLASCRTAYFPTYDEESLQYYTDSYGMSTSIKPNDSLSQFVNKWYSKHLYNSGEPVLYKKTHKSTNIIRFMHIGSWSNPYSYRIEQVGSKVSVTYSETGRVDYESNRIIKHGTKKADFEKWNLVIAKMDSISFWSMETHDKNEILDGAEWIFEALINGQYHFVTRNSPNDYDGKEYAELCNLIAQIWNE